MQITHVNDWNRMAENLGPEHMVILRSTLPTQSLSFLLTAYMSDCDARLTSLDVNLDAEEFRTKYAAIRRQKEFAETFNSFCKSLAIET